MSDGADTGGLSGDLRELVVRSLRGNVDLLRRATELGRGVAGELKAAPPTPQDLVDRLARLNLHSLNLLTDYGQALAGELLSAAEKAFNPSAGRDAPGDVPAPAAEPDGTTTELRVEAVEGTLARTGFVIENRFSQPVSVALSATPFRTDAGDSAPASCIELDPASAVIAAGGDQLVIVEVELDAWFRTGVDYRSTIHVKGNPSREIALVLRALPRQTDPGKGGDAQASAGAPSTAPSAASAVDPPAAQPAEVTLSSAAAQAEASAPPRRAAHTRRPSAPKGGGTPEAPKPRGGRKPRGG
jgi:hypothetical protein